MDPTIKPPVKAVEVELSDSIRSLFLKRARQHVHDSYAGIPMMKFPESLRIYEHLIWSGQVNTIVELGCLYGGSTLWFRDRLAAYARYREGPAFHIYAVDVNLQLATENLTRVDPDFAKNITLIKGSVTDPQVGQQLATHLPADSKVLVIEDTAHIYETTYGALVNFSDLVRRGGFFVIEDGYLDGELRKDFDPAELEFNGVKFGGVLKAIADWRVTVQGRKFRRAEDWELYGISNMPQGILQHIG